MVCGTEARDEAASNKARALGAARRIFTANCLADFSRVGGVRIPPAVFNDPSKIAINGAGQILAQIDEEHFWLWDGSSARTLPAIPAPPRAAVTPGPTPSRLRQWLLGDDGGSLFALEGTSRQLQGSEADTSITALLVRSTDFSQPTRERIFTGQSRPCQEHEMLSDFRIPCPDPEIWAPGGVVRDFLVLSRCEQDAHDRALEYLTRAIDAGLKGSAALTNPDLENVHKDPRFAKLADRLQ